MSRAEGLQTAVHLRKTTRGRGGLTKVEKGRYSVLRAAMPLSFSSARPWLHEPIPAGLEVYTTRYIALFSLHIINSRPSASSIVF